MSVRRPGVTFTKRCLSNLADPQLRRGDWLIIGVLGIHKAVAIDQLPICVNTITGERRVCPDWDATKKLGPIPTQSDE